MAPPTFRGAIPGSSTLLPTVEGWEPDLANRQGLPVFIRHGRADPVIGVDFARQARELLTPAGLEIDYGEFDGGHFIEPASTPAAAAWLSGIFPTGAGMSQ